MVSTVTTLSCTEIRASAVSSRKASRRPGPSAPRIDPSGARSVSIEPTTNIEPVRSEVGPLPRSARRST